VTWFEPFVFLALLPATNEKTALDGSREDEPRAGEGPEQEGDVSPSRTGGAR
jgi:hypothetical protein